MNDLQELLNTRYRPGALARIAENIHIAHTPVINSLRVVCTVIYEDGFRIQTTAQSNWWNVPEIFSDLADWEQAAVIEVLLGLP